MKHIKIFALAFCLPAFMAAQNVTVHKQGGVGHVYRAEQVDSVVYFPIGDGEQFPAPEEENTKSLWDIIKAQPNLKKFAAILEAANYYTTNGAEKKATDQKLCQVLDGSLPMNVYAPTDAAISDAEYDRLLSLAKTDGWKLQQEFAFNHISPQEGGTAFDGNTVMLNGKRINTNACNPVPADEEAAAGKLFAVSTIIPYLPSMKEYLQILAPDCTQAQAFMAGLKKVDTDADASILAIPTRGGEQNTLLSIISETDPLASQYLHSDGLMQIKGFGAGLADESASYMMVTPTDAVWNDASTKLANLYRYASRYEDKIKGDMGNRTYIDVANPDSLASLSMGADILTSLLGKTTDGQQTKLSNGTAYAATEWPVSAAEYMPDVEVELEHDAVDTVACHIIMFDSLGRSYYPWVSEQNYGALYSKKFDMYYDGNWCAFNEEEDKYYTFEYHREPVDTIFNDDGTIADIHYKEYNDTIPLTPSVVPETAQRTSFIYNNGNSGSLVRLGTNSRCISFDNDCYAEITDNYGRVSNNNFYLFSNTGTGPSNGPRVEIKLQGKNGEQVMSGKYDIQVVMVPYWYSSLSQRVCYEYWNTMGLEENRVIYTTDISLDIPAEWRDPESGQINQNVIDSIANVSKQKFNVSITYNENGSERNRMNLMKGIVYDGLKIDNITVVEDFEFPTSYKNIPASYPVLYIECIASKSDLRTGFINQLCIDKIILKSKEDGTEIDVTP